MSAGHVPDGDRRRCHPIARRRWLLSAENLGAVLGQKLSHLAMHERGMLVTSTARSRGAVRRCQLYDHVGGHAATPVTEVRTVGSFLLQQGRCASSAEDSRRLRSFAKVRFTERENAA